MFKHWPWRSKRLSAVCLQDCSGAAAVEFAMIVWPLVLLLLGTVEVGRILWVQSVLDKTAITAARCIGIRNDKCANHGTFNQSLATDFVQKEGSRWGVSLAPKAITILDGVECDGSPGFSRVSLAVEIISPLPFIAKLISGSDQMKASACFPTQVSEP